MKDLSDIKRKYVIPGELIVEGNFRPIANVFRQGTGLYSTRIGLAEIGHQEVRVIPLCGPYIPRVDDFIIGKVVDYSGSAWEVDINSCFFAFLPAQNVFGRNFSPQGFSLENKFRIGDILAAKVAAYDRTRDPLLTISGPGLGLIEKGEIVKIAPTKVPRLIGKKRSMIMTIEGSSTCKLIIGQNGIVVVNGPPNGLLIAIKAIKLVEEEAHNADLITKVQNLLSA